MKRKALTAAVVLAMALTSVSAFAYGGHCIYEEYRNDACTRVCESCGEQLSRGVCTGCGAEQRLYRNAGCHANGGRRHRR